MEACERIPHIFYLLLALFTWNLGLVSGSHLSLCVATVPRIFLDDFRLFLRESGLRAPCAVLTLEI